MSGENLKEVRFQAAVEMIELLKGTMDSLEMNLSQVRDENEELERNAAALEEENMRLQEKVMQLESALSSMKEKGSSAENRSDEIRDLEKKLSFYYQDMKAVDARHLTAEDSETLYNILVYTFKILRKAGLNL